MKKRILVPVILLLVLLASVVLVHWRARQILIGLIESNTDNRVKVTIGQLSLNPFKSSISLKDANLLVRDPGSPNYTRTEFKRIFLDVASLWEFIQGGTLMIEKLECEGGDVTLFNTNKRDSTAQKFTLASLLENIKSDVIRFQIQDMKLNDINLHLIQDSLLPPISIQHIHAYARKLYLSADSIRNRKPEVGVSLPAQQLILPAGVKIAFDTLFFSNADNAIQLNQLVLESSANEPTKAYHLEADKVRIAHIDFETLYTQGKLIIDSVAFEHGSLKSDWTINQPKKKKSPADTLNVIPEILVRSIIVNQLGADLSLHKDDIENNFKVGYSRVTIDHLHHNPDSVQIISALDFSIVLAQYQTFLSNRKTSISFDTIRLQKHELDLLNFKLFTADQKQPVLQTSLFRIKEANWDQLLFYRNLVAHEALAVNPIINLRIKPSENKAPSNNRVLLNTLNDFLDVQRLTLQNARALALIQKDSTRLSMNGFNASIQVNQMMESTTVDQALQAINYLNFSELIFNQPRTNGHAKGFSYSDRNPFLKEVHLQSGNSVNLTVQDIAIENPVWNEEENKIKVDGLTWRSLILNLITQPKSTKTSPPSSLPVVHIRGIRGGTGDILVTTPTLQASTKIHHLNLDQFILQDSLQFSGLDFSGGQLKFNQANTKASIDQFQFTEKEGKLDHVEFSSITKDSLEVSIQSILSRWNLNALTKQIVEVNDLKAQTMIVKYTSRDSLNALRIYGDHDLQLHDLHFEQPKLTVGSLVLKSLGQEIFIESKKEYVEPVAEETRRTNANRFRLTFDSLTQSRLNPARLRPTTLRDSLEERKSDKPMDTLQFIYIQSPSGGVSISLQNLETTFRDSVAHIRTEIPALSLHQLNLKTNSLSARIPSGTIGHLTFNSDQANDLRQLLQTNLPVVSLTDLKARLETKTSTIEFNQLNYDPSLKQGTLTGFEFKPNLDKDEYLKSRYYQTDYIRTKIKSITFSNPGLNSILEDSVIRLSSLSVYGPELDIHRDKTHPFMTTAIRPLPTNAFQKARFHFNIDSLSLSDGHISYTEKSRITGREGVILLTSMNGMVRSIKNTELEPGDSLWIQASTRFLDSAKVNLQFKESYQDSLGGFKLTAQLSPFHTSILNPVLLPLVAVEFKSGAIDTMMMSSIGREHISLGSMKFFYHDLKVEFLDKQDTSKHSVKNAILKFAANTFVVRTNNQKRVGTVYYERDRNRGVFQYWVKMILSGVTTSVGARTNKHQIKKYKKQLKINKIPPIDPVLMKK